MKIRTDMLIDTTILYSMLDFLEEHDKAELFTALVLNHEGQLTDEPKFDDSRVNKLYNQLKERDNENIEKYLAKCEKNRINQINRWNKDKLIHIEESANAYGIKVTDNDKKTILNLLIDYDEQEIESKMIETAKRIIEGKTIDSPWAYIRTSLKNAEKPIEGAKAEPEEQDDFDKYLKSCRI